MPSPPPRAPASGLADQFCVLFVDDDTAFLNLIEGWMTHLPEPYSAVEAAFCSDLDSATERYRLVSTDRIPVCFIDLHIENELDGLSLIGMLRAFRPDAFFCVLTNDALISSLLTAVRTSIIDFRIKRDITDEHSLARVIISTLNSIALTRNIIEENLIRSFHIATQSFIHDLEKQLMPIRQHFERGMISVTQQIPPGHPIGSTSQQILSGLDAIHGNLIDYLDNVKHFNVSSGTRLSAAKIVEISRQQLVRSVADAVYSTCTKADIKVSDELHSAHYLVDMARTVRIILNFASNASKFARTNIPLQIRLAFQDSVADDVNYLTISIQDNGYGIGEARLGDILRYGKKAENNLGKPGLGLGLWFSSRLAESHVIEGITGKIEYENVPGLTSETCGGAIFKLLLGQPSDSRSDQERDCVSEEPNEPGSDGASN